MSLEPTKSVEVLMQEAHALVAQGELKEAETLLLELVKISDAKTKIECYEALTVFAQTKNDADASIRYALQTLNLHKEMFGEESEQAISSMVRLAELYEKVGRDEEANHLLFRVKILSDKLVYGQSDTPEPEVGSAEAGELYRSTLKYYAKNTTEPIEDSTQRSVDELDEREKDDPNFVFAEDEPRPEKSGWLMDSIQKAANRKSETTGGHPVTKSSPKKSKGEITGAHQFRADEPKPEEKHRYMTRKSDAQEQSESRSNASAVRKDLDVTGSSIKAIAHGKEEIARTFDLSNIMWSLREFVKKKTNIVGIGIGAFVFFLMILVGAYFQPRKVTPLDAYVAMPHVYKSILGETRINLVKEDSLELQQGDTTMPVATGYLVDWRSHLEVFLRSLFEKQFWLKKVGSTLVSDEGVTYFTPNHNELLIVDQMQNIASAANTYYLEHSNYPNESALPLYRNIYTRAASKPRVKRSELICSDVDDVVRQVETWKADLAKSTGKEQAGVIDCQILVATYPQGRVELFAVRACKQNEQPQVLVSTKGELSAEAHSKLVPEGMGIRFRRVWIEIEDVHPADSFCLHHASLIFFLFVSTVVASSYAFLNLRGDARTMRFRLLFCSLAMVAFYAAGTYLSF